MKILLLGDEDFNQKVLALLTLAGHDVTSIKELGLDRQWLPDEEVLQIASELGRVVLTHNKNDFIKLHRSVDKHAGIITCYQTANAEKLSGKIINLLKKEEELENKLFRVYKGND